MTTPTPNPHTTANPLQTENPAIVGILTEQTDFDAMHTLTAFPVTDYTDYLHHTEDLLRTHTANGQHTIAVLLDPDDYTDYCTDHTLDPTLPTSRAHYTAQDAFPRAHVAYHGQDLPDLIADLVDEATHNATWQYATETLNQLLGPCTRCGYDIGRAAQAHAARLTTTLLNHTNAGPSTLICAVSAPHETLHATLHTEHDALPDEDEARYFTTVLAAGLATNSPGGTLLRTAVPGTRERVHGWRIHHGSLQPLTAAETFDAYLTDHVTGDPVGPEPGVDHCAGFDLPHDTSRPAHNH